MYMYFKTKTDVAHNLVHKFFLTLTVKRPFHRKDLSEKKYEGTGLISKNTEALHVELNKRVEASTSSYSAPGNF